MIVYRICKKDNADDLTGIGAKLYGGRWNSKGVSMLYTSSTRALAALEVLVHIPATIPIKDYIMLSMELPENSMEEILLSVLKKENKEWHDGYNSIGDNWCKKRSSLVLKVPSIIIQEEYNYLLNPEHSLFSKIKINEKNPFNFDRRLTDK